MINGTTAVKIFSPLQPAPLYPEMSRKLLFSFAYLFCGFFPIANFATEARTQHDELARRIEDDSIFAGNALKTLLSDINRDGHWDLLEKILSNPDYGIRLLALEELPPFPAEFKLQGLASVLRNSQAWLPERKISELMIAQKKFVESIVSALAEFGISTDKASLENEAERLRIADILLTRHEGKGVTTPNDENEQLANGSSAQVVVASASKVKTESEVVSETQKTLPENWKLFLFISAALLAGGMILYLARLK